MTETQAQLPLLFQPLTIGAVTMRNRIMVSPMCQYISVDGMPIDWHMAHLGHFAMGGAGIVFYEETAIEDRGRKTYGCAGIWRDDQIASFRRITDLLKSLGSVPAMQLGHAGGKASTGDIMEGFRHLTEEDAKSGRPPWIAIAPSAVEVDPGHPLPKAMDVADIRSVQKNWREATLRSLDAGFDIMEIHGAHGYLIHEFLSPVTNHRTDGYGGSRQNRMRFALEITEIVRDVWPKDKPLFFRVSCIDGKGGLWGLEDTIALARELKMRGVDVIDCSSGGINGTSTMGIIPRRPGYHVPYASAVRREAGVMTAAVGLITEAEQAEAILEEGHADIVAIARELLANSHWPVEAARKLGVSDSYELYPGSYSYRLRRRDRERSHPINQPGAKLPTGTDTFVTLD